MTTTSALGNRLQRSRRKGSIIPPGAIYVGRPTKWGNPFMVARFGHMKAVRLHRRWLLGQMGALTLEGLGFDPGEIDAIFRLLARVRADIHHLAGRDLVCWCAKTAPCHADALIELSAHYAELERLVA